VFGGRNASRGHYHGAGLGAILGGAESCETSEAQANEEPAMRHERIKRESEPPINYDLTNSGSLAREARPCVRVMSGVGL
jgi:hypothetical protein